MSKVLIELGLTTVCLGIRTNQSGSRPPPERGLKYLKRDFKPLNVKAFPFDADESRTPGTPTTPSPTAARRDNVWRSVFHPGSNLATKSIGADYFDRPQPNSPTVYDWLYSGETRSKHQ
ncbi:UNVERIFIED_CONTAM: Auxin-repressed protein [Sesamum calycinum]|uniref:Auxin-repressed protein n=1 Tax=Sesamum calycinum TaxID=2727403 RepID=A0AAW2MDH9_9LAMI